MPAPPLLLLLLLLLPASALAQAADVPSPGAAAAGEVAVEPIRCWWRTDRSAVHLGERFTLTLTCRVVETASVTVSPSLTALEPGAVLLTPFESVGGVRHEDVVAPPYRYVQFEYSVRFMGEGAFGTDVAIPPLTVPYTIQSAAGGGAQGREQQYVLPTLPMRIVSLAPREATDIRDASPETFASIQAHRFRSTAALVGAGLFFGLAVVLVGIAGVRVVSGRTRRRAAVARPVPAPMVLQGCAGVLRQVRAAAARDGWSPALARRAVTALRIAGASAIGRPVAQTPVTGTTTPADGQLLLRRGIVRRRAVLVSAATTPGTLAAHLQNGHAPPPRRRAVVESLHGALQTFSTQAYGRSDDLDGPALDAALEHGASAIRRLQVQSLWPGARNPEPRAWTRN